MKHKKGTQICNDPDCWCSHFPSKPVAPKGRILSEGELPDMVNQPPHYKLDGLDVEALDIIRAVLSKEEYIGYLVGNCLKYSMRSSKKNGKEDLRKMYYYANELENILK